MEETQVQIIRMSNTDEQDFVENWYEIADVDHFWMKWRSRVLFQAIKGLGISTEEKLIGLDVGCGAGVVRKQIEGNSQWIIDGTDLNIKSLRLNKGIKGSTYFYDILDRSEEFKDKYDVILLFDILEHIKDTKLFLDSCLFHLKSGGVIFLNVPAISNLYSKYDESAGHFKRYDRKTLLNEIEELPLKDIDVRFWGMTLVPFLFLRKMFVRSQSDEDVIRKGFKPRNNFINSMFEILMKVETNIKIKPFIGTSLLAAFRKTRRVK